MQNIKNVELLMIRKDVGKFPYGIQLFGQTYIQFSLSVSLLLWFSFALLLSVSLSLSFMLLTSPSSPLQLCCHCRNVSACRPDSNRPCFQVPHRHPCCYLQFFLYLVDGADEGIIWPYFSPSKHISLVCIYQIINFLISHKKKFYFFIILNNYFYSKNI